MAKLKNRSQYLMAEPNWAKLSLATNEEEKYQAWADTRYFIHQEISSRESYKAFRDWISKSGWDKKIQERVKAAPDYCYISIGEHAWFSAKVGWMPQQLRDYIEKRLPYLLEKGDKAIEEKKNKSEVIKLKPKVIRTQLEQFLSAFDESLDNLGDGKKAANIESLLKQIVLIPKELAEAHNELSGVKDEIDELVRVRKIKGGRSDWDEQLIEGYSHWNTPTTRKILAFLTEGLTAIDSFTATKKTVRRRKPQDPRKIVARLRHLKADKDFNIASINPVDILGSTEVWTYDVKRKRLGLYMSANPGGLNVHGTSIQGYDDDLSYEKTLRKPEEQLPLITKKSKKALHEQVGKIRGKQMKVKTRINANMLLLKVQ